MLEAIDRAITTGVFGIEYRDRFPAPTLDEE
jgi:hypothetical protein